VNDLVDDLQKEWADQRPDLDCSSLGVVVRVQLLAKLANENAEQALERFSLKLWEYDVLSALRRQGKPYELLGSELARASMLTSGTVTTRIDGLERRKLVRRRRDARDRRIVRISLTSRGLTTIDGAIEARIASADEQLRVLSSKERKSLTSTLRKVLHTAALRNEEAAEYIG
jgi:DNA-binding MarR family transcriptional regulator